MLKKYTKNAGCKQLQLEDYHKEDDLKESRREKELIQRRGY